MVLALLEPLGAVETEVVDQLKRRHIVVSEGVDAITKKLVGCIGSLGTQVVHLEYKYGN